MSWNISTVLLALLYSMPHPQEVSVVGIEFVPDWPSLFSCSEDSSFFLSQLPWDCSYYVMCVNGEMTFHACPPGMVFSGYSLVCDWPTLHDVGRCFGTVNGEVMFQYFVITESCEFESWQEWRENFLLQSQLCVLTLIRWPFHPRVTAVARKRPRSFCQKCRSQVTHQHEYILDPSKPGWAIQTECGNLSANELTRNSSGNTRSQSSQLAEPLWTDPGLKSGSSLRKLISTFKKKKKSAGGGMNCRTFSQNPRT